MSFRKKIPVLLIRMLVKFNKIHFYDMKKRHTAATVLGNGKRPCTEEIEHSTPEGDCLCVFLPPCGRRNLPVPVKSLVVVSVKEMCFWSRSSHIRMQTNKL